MALRIRPATPGDAAVIADIHIAASITAYRSILGSDYTPSLDDRIIMWQRILSHDETLDPPGADHVLVGCEQDAVVGFIAAGRSRDPDAAGAGEVHVLYISPAIWRGGAGKALMAAGLEYLRLQGFSEATLWVLAENRRARSFYEKEGWSPDGAAKPGTSRPDVIQIRYRRPLG